MKAINKLVILAIGLLVMNGCREDQFGPLHEDGGAPGVISEVKIENLAGGAKISYRLPDDQNLLYVKAVYQLKGQETDAKASYLKNHIIVEGFGDTDERDVTLYAVSRSEKLSQPVTVKIKPLPAPIYDVYHTLQVEETFGGVVVNFENGSAINGGVNSNIVVGVLVWDDELDEWRQIDTYYSGLSIDKFAVRGLDAIPYQFGFFMKDRWGNFTDTLEMNLTPIYEEELDKSLWRDVRGQYPVPQVGVLPISGNTMLEGTDYSGSYVLNRMWDGNTGTMYHSKQALEQPIWIPFDLGRKTKLSRYKIWQRQGANWVFMHGNPHEWEIWGTNTPQDPGSWQLLTHEVMEKPSGLPVGQNSNDDTNIASAGQEYDFPLDVPEVRYLAWKHIDNWDAIEGEFGFIHIAELSLWGQ